ncbi:uncharacterized protein TRUGW13939_09372 [Talaromyces rugulosus]|uniref:Uncharacterized protein n=1 Tax=Talaromyces rugulosus TaxID=121627 RepID=A0A7H8RCE7_TALRU|nr:uncharacterized protein TRUGW13939_09372 [Talaromyces rugulosus]QKX62213.1 hypothetical protein TRUGW13939_09372 [Talaromyces rugulosus]
MSEATFHTTKEDIRKPESGTAKARGGVPANSSISAMKSIIDSNTNKPEQINQAKSNLPLPDQPPTSSDWNSFDQRTVNVGSGRLETGISGEGNSALRGPAAAESSVRIDGSEYHKLTQPTGNVGRQGQEGLSDLPKDALLR